MTVECCPPDDAKHLVRLCEAGRLYEIEEWIRAGRPLQVPPDLRKTPLRAALTAGFHSLIELLLRHEPSQTAKDQALVHAVQLRRLDLVELAVKYGADIRSVAFGEVLENWDKGIMRFFIERGADLVTDVPFAYAFHAHIRTALGVFLECKRTRPDLAEQLQEQANIALRQVAKEGNLKWVSLLMWAGADPRSHGPTLDDLDDPDMFTTAFEEACSRGHLEVLKRLKPDPQRDDLGALLRPAAFSAHTDVLMYLLELGANPNDKPTGGSSALDACIHHLNWEDIHSLLYGGRDRQTPGYKVHNTRAAIRMLIEHGAVWSPGETLNDARRTLCHLEPEVTTELVGLLVKHHACDDTALHNLLRTQRMRAHMASSENRLARIGLTLDGRRRSDSRSGREAAPPSPYLLRRYDRQTLYKELWSEPTQKVATRYGISDVALAKIAKHLRVPKPPRGYWAKKNAGVPVPPRPKLSALEVQRRRPDTAW
jgi:hypothetical protein